MPIHLSPEDDARREERLKNSPKEKTAALAQKAGAESAVSKELDKDTINKTYQDYWSGIVQSYEDEIVASTGFHLTLSPSTPWNSSVVNSVVEQTAQLQGPLNKPSQGQPLRMPEFYPAHPSGEYCAYTTDAGLPGSFESDTDAWYADSLIYLKNGFNDGAVATTTVSSVTASSTSLDLNDAVSAGIRLVIRGGGSSAIALTKTSGTTPDIEWVKTLSGQSFAPNSAISGTVTATLPAFTNSERTTMTSVNYQEILTKAKAGWVAYVTAVKTFIQSQKTIFDANQHDQKDPAYSGVLDNRLTQLTTYLTTSLVTDTALSSIYTNTLFPRITERNARISALPAVLGPLYDKRYTFSNLRGNSILGSYALYSTYSKGVALAQANIDFATSSASAYET